MIASARSRTARPSRGRSLRIDRGRDPEALVGVVTATRSSVDVEDVRRARARQPPPQVLGGVRVRPVAHREGVEPGGRGRSNSGPARKSASTAWLSTPRPRAATATHSPHRQRSRGLPAHVLHDRADRLVVADPRGELPARPRSLRRRSRGRASGTSPAVACHCARPRGARTRPAPRRRARGSAAGSSRSARPARRRRRRRAGWPARTGSRRRASGGTRRSTKRALGSSTSRSSVLRRLSSAPSPRPTRAPASAPP